MNRIAQNLVADSQNLAMMPASKATEKIVGGEEGQKPSAFAPRRGALSSLLAHWPEYLMEAVLLGAFMVSACVFGILSGLPGSPVRQAVSSTFFRGLLGGIAMGLTALCIIYSPWGKQSGAHINPCVTDIPPPGQSQVMGRHLLYRRAIQRGGARRCDCHRIPAAADF